MNHDELQDTLVRLALAMMITATTIVMGVAFAQLPLWVSFVTMVGIVFVVAFKHI